MKIITIKAIIILVAVITLNVIMPVAGAQVELYSAGACGKSGGGEVCSKMDDADIGPIIQVIINTLLYVAGAVSIIFMIMGGFKYVTSAGDSGKAASARNTIIYALAGLIVATLAYVIVQYVYGSISPGAGSAAPGGVT